MKIRPVGAELIHADRRTDMIKLIVVFRNFAKAPITFSIPPPTQCSDVFIVTIKINSHYFPIKH